MARERRVRLLTVLIALAVLSVAVGFFNAMYAGYQAQKTQVVKNTFDSNLAYAQKLADIINLYIQTGDRQLTAGANRIPRLADAPGALQVELSALAGTIEGVTAVLLADPGGRITSRSEGSPSPLDAVKQLDELGVRELRAGQWARPCCLPGARFATLTLVEPVPGPQNAVSGYLAAIVVLEHGSGLDRLVGQHAYADGTSVYLVNGEGQMLYRHGADADIASAVQARLSPATGPGVEQVTDAAGAAVIAGYAPLVKGNWAVVVQRPLDSALSPLKDLLAASLQFAIPAVVLTLLLVCACAYAIARPLARLADAFASDEPVGPTALRASTLKTWYFEAEKLRQALAAAQARHREEVGRLNTESLTDPMTGLMNRRALRARIDELVAAASPFAVIALDLDHFKRINDVYGHPTGDKVLVTVSRTLQEHVRAGDQAFRIGGEEFVLILPQPGAQGIARDIAQDNAQDNAPGTTHDTPHDTTHDAARLAARTAAQAAERIRAAVAASPMPDGVRPVTVSVGVALWPQDGASPQAVIKCADQALYESKQTGRDRVTMWDAVAKA